MNIQDLGDRGLSTSSHTTYVASMICFAAVIADAYMLDICVSHDVRGRPLGRMAAHPTTHVSAPAGIQRLSDPCFYEVSGVYTCRDA